MATFLYSFSPSDSEDEIDALATSRTSSEKDHGPSHESILTSLLNEMDRVQELTGVTVVAVTNRQRGFSKSFFLSFSSSFLFLLGFNSYEIWPTRPNPLRRTAR